MKKFLLVPLLIPLAGLGTLYSTFTAQTLPVPAGYAVKLPEATPPPELTLSAIRAGKMFNQAAFAYRGGSFGETRVFGMGAILVRHPHGALLFDSGFGRNVEAHFRTTPWLMQATSKYETEATVADQLKAAGIDASMLKGVILTHAHWDHVSGLEDLPGTPVLVNAAEREFIEAGGPPTALARGLGALNFQIYQFESGPYLGFDQSHDVFGDGSVVLVPAPGHTPGSIIAFISTPDGQRYALVGDLVWQREGVDLPAEKPFISRRMVDWDEGKVRDLVVRMHQLQKAVPGLIVVPAHDRRVWDALPQLSP
ncbi:MAG: MBL fold metallo-hydrolase [Stagnimonas sp.]|nr:MBL fold metallo-hydrolase [Stagnimonas sp.]